MQSIDKACCRLHLNSAFFKIAELEEEEKMKQIAEESAATRKVREKIQKKIDKLEKKITPDAIKKKIREMHKWIAKHAGQRVILRTKSISLFDGNQHAAQMSRKAIVLAEQLKKETKSTIESQQLLKKMVSLQPKEVLKSSR